jgi:glycosyltransferase involved in cell wall biosynthesis
LAGERLSTPRISVIIPTRDRPLKVAETLEAFRTQTVEDYEVLVIDDGSQPPITLDRTQHPRCTVTRLAGGGRSAARNAGAATAVAPMLVFLDDDISVGPDFLEQHLLAHEKWIGAIVVGAIRLPRAAMQTPFGRFRQRLEDHDLPSASLPSDKANFCAAGNMSISRERFLELGGFDVSMASSEDQDLGLRHGARGGIIAFAAEASGVHRDDALDARSYCRRTEWGFKNLVPFCIRHPDLPDNRERERINGAIRWGREPLQICLHKLAKRTLSTRPAVGALFAMTALLERIAPDAILERAYRILLGVHIARGYRRGRLDHQARASADPRTSRGFQ